MYQTDVVLPIIADGNRNLLLKEFHLQMFKTAIADVLGKPVQQYLKQEFGNNLPILETISKLLPSEKQTQKAIPVFLNYSSFMRTTLGKSTNSKWSIQIGKFYGRRR